MFSKSTGCLELARLGCFLWLAPGWVVSVFVVSGLAAQPVDFATQISPVFQRNCAGGSCHIDRSASGVDLTTYDSLASSFGFQYDSEIVLPFDAVASPLVDKISSPSPRFGSRMPLVGAPLDEAEIELIARWIDEGAVRVARRTLRGDVTRDQHLDISDAIALLGYLFLGDASPHCDPVADANDDQSIDLSDPVKILDYLFLGGTKPPLLSVEEEAECGNPNRPPQVEPLGTIEGREGVLIRFSVVAIDLDRADSLTFSAEEVPDGFELDAQTGDVEWTPRVGQSGDHRIRIRVTDDGSPPASTLSTGLIRVRQGNRAPTLEDLDTIYGRETVLLEFVWTAEDIEGDAFSYEFVEAPDGSSLDLDTGRFVWTPALGQAGSHVLRVRVTDDGIPSRSSEGDVELVIVEVDAAVNQPPFVPSRSIYRTYPGRPIEIPIGATDPDGDGLRYEAEGLPAGAEFDAANGIFRWVPSSEQLGPFYVTFAATDDGTPPLRVEGTLVFRVMPDDPCSRPDCDPARGCTETVADLVEACCVERPIHRVAEPVAECPDGRVLHVGRNRRGFGRMQNCDWLRVEPFGQGGHTVSLNVEARCINADEPVNVRLRLETIDYLLFDRESARLPQKRADGFAQRLGFFMEVDRNIPVFELEATEALLTCVLTDADGTRLERRLRVVLTRGGLDDLPEPDVADVPAGEAGCVGCHRPVTSNGERHGIEDAHPWFALSCVDCHGGDAEAVTRADAHVAADGSPEYLRGLASDVLDAVAPDYLQFVNPGDLRVASMGCGSQSPANPGGACHQSVVDSVQKSVMATYAGHYTLPRYLAGSQTRESIFAAVDIIDEFFDPETAPEGAVRSLQALREPRDVTPRGTVGACIDVYLPKSCPTCHLGTFGPDNSPGNYRSSGCTACHMTYAEDGLSRSADPVIDPDFPSHPLLHQLTNAPSTEQCSRCHFQGGRIGLAYRGIREGGFAPEKTPSNGVTLGRVLHAHDENYYFVDEDDTNDIDETPPDVHFQSGMDCADCHIGGDVHGDGNLYVSERYQVGIRCEDCHGTVRAEIEPDPTDGTFNNSKGFAMRRVRRTDDDRIVLRLARSGKELEIPQIHRVLESGVNQAMVEAMGVQENGFSHTDSLECYACHTSWRQTCFGCHVTIDDRTTGPNLTTGLESQGGISVSRDDYSLDFFALGMNRRGKITPLCSSMSVFVSYIDKEGNTQFRDRVRTSGDGRNGFGWNPFHHHTVSRVPQNCDRCHAVEGGVNESTLRETYGFGTGRFLVPGEGGEVHDVSAFLDDGGGLIGDFPHSGTGPVPRDIRERAASITVTPHPRQ